MKGTLPELDAYDYTLPKERIATKPAKPRDAARLLIYDRKKDTVSFDIFRNLGRYLPQKSVIVTNDTQVVPARLFLKKETGGSVEFLVTRIRSTFVEGLLNHNLQPGAKLLLDHKYFFTVVSKIGTGYRLRPAFHIKRFPALLRRFGKTPLPPYMKRSPLREAARRREYQTVFAKRAGSIAAPTAGLHFTKRLLRTLEQDGHTIIRITLHVGLGTFAPLTPEHLKTNALHEEYYEISKRAARAIERAKQSGRPITAIGTTVVRTLESAAKRGILQATRGRTDLFIRPGYQFKIVDHLITNFHVPRSSLMMLVAALTGREKLLVLYAQAQKEHMRFFSFGDGMLIL